MQDGTVLCGNLFPTPLDTGPSRHAYIYWVDEGVTEGEGCKPRYVSTYNEVLSPDPPNPEYHTRVQTACTGSVLYLRV